MVNSLFVTQHDFVLFMVFAAMSFSFLFLQLCDVVLVFFVEKFLSVYSVLFFMPSSVAVRLTKLA